MKTLTYIPDLIRNIDSELKDIIGEDLPILSSIRDYTIESGGKRVRPVLLYLLAAANGQSSREVFALGAIVEVIHAASLLHDDVIDEANERRGRPSGRVLFGNKEVILGGDYLLACGIGRLNRFENPALTHVFTRALKNLSIAELLQAEYSGRADINRPVYDNIIYGKTASLFESAAEAAAIYSNLSGEESRNYADFGRKLGVFFQMRDDYLDYFNAGLLKKPAFTDYVNGLYTYPVFIARENLNGEALERLESLMGDSPEERSDKKRQKELLQVFEMAEVKTRAIEELGSLRNELLEFVKQLPESKEADLIAGQVEALSHI